MLVVFTLLLVLSLVGPAVFAQHIRGALEGTVTDPNGALVLRLGFICPWYSTGLSVRVPGRLLGRFSSALC